MKSLEKKLRRDAAAIYRAALDAADAASAVRRSLSLRRSRLKAGSVEVPLSEFDRIFLLSIGKAAVPMAAAVEELLGHHLESGLAVTKHGHAASPLKRCITHTSGHPVPDESGLAAANQVQRLLSELNARDLLLVAISGGASALLPAPAPPLTLDQKQKTTDLLLRAGANIQELNAVRKHLSSLKGGGLAVRAFPATVISLLLSDVIGDPLDVIGSGPTAPDPGTYGDAVDVLSRYRLIERVPPPVLQHLEAGVRGEVAETPKPGDPIFRNVHNLVIGSNRASLEAAAAAARKLGYRALILSSTVAGETRDVARVHAAILREVCMHASPLPRPACLLSGGETTVTVTGHGKGGRNQEFALSAAIAIDGLSNALVLSLGTDGTDGPTDAAGALATGQTLSRACRHGLHAGRTLADNNAYPFFETLGDLVKTGPTGTNVMDINILLAG